VSGQYYGIDQLGSFWGTKPAETVLKIGLIVSDNAHYFGQFETNKLLLLAVKRAVIDRKQWDSMRRRWVRMEAVGGLN